MSDPMTPERIEEFMANAPEVERGELWSLLDWSFWGAGMADTFREPLADTMLAAIPADARGQAEAIMADFIRRRKIEKTGVTIYQEQRDELERLREQRDRARMAVDRVSRLFDSDAIDETGLSHEAVSDAIADVAQLCPGCWRIHGTWCHPYGGPIADPDPTALKRDLGGEEAKSTPENTAREDIERD